MMSVITYPHLWVVMKQRRLVQTDLARMLRYSDNKISRKLRGIQALTATEKEIIARELGVNVVWLFSEILTAPMAVETTLANLDHIEKR